MEEAETVHFQFTSDFAKQEDCKKCTCPSCYRLGLLSELQLFKINFTQAIYLCTSDNCSFPLLERDVQSFLVDYSASTAEEKAITLCYDQDDLELDKLLMLLTKNDNEQKSQQPSVNNLIDNFPDVCSETINDQCTQSKLSNFQNTQSLKLIDFSYKSQISKNSDKFFQNSCANFNLRDDAALNETPNKSVLSQSQTFISQSSPVPRQDYKEFSVLKKLGSSCRNSHVLQWKNSNNLCWLDVLLHCFVNSDVIRAAINCKLSSDNLGGFIYTICQSYDNIQEEYSKAIFHSINFDTTRELLCERMTVTRMQVFSKLQSKCLLRTGSYESVTEMFPECLKLDQTVCEVFETSCRMEFKCAECHFKRLHRFLSSCITFPSTATHFHPLNATYVRNCFKCNAENQTVFIGLEKISPLLAMHFEDGLPHNRFNVLDFGLQGHLYSIIVIIQYMIYPSKHFIAWIRNVKTNEWLCCDDMKNIECRWTSKPPNFPSNEVHVVIWENQSISLKHSSTENKALLNPIDNEIPLIFEPYPDESNDTTVLSDLEVTDHSDDGISLFCNPGDCVDLNNYAEIDKLDDESCVAGDIVPTCQADTNNGKSFVHKLAMDIDVTIRDSNICSFTTDCVASNFKLEQNDKEIYSLEGLYDEFENKKKTFPGESNDVVTSNVNLPDQSDIDHYEGIAKPVSCQITSNHENIISTDESTKNDVVSPIDLDECCGTIDDVSYIFEKNEECDCTIKDLLTYKVERTSIKTPVKSVYTDNGLKTILQSESDPYIIPFSWFKDMLSPVVNLKHWSQKSLSHFDSVESECELKIKSPFTLQPIVECQKIPDLIVSNYNNGHPIKIEVVSNKMFGETKSGWKLVRKFDKIMPTLDDNRRFADVSVIPMKIVDTPITFDKDVFVKSPQAADCTCRVTDDACSLTSYDWHTESEDISCDDDDEWMPPSKSRKLGGSSNDWKSFDEPFLPSDRVVRFVHLLHPREPISRKLLAPDYKFDGYVSKLRKGSDGSRQSAINSFSKKWLGNKGSKEHLLKNQSQYFLAEEVDSGYGDCHSVESSMTTDFPMSISSSSETSSFTLGTLATTSTIEFAEHRSLSTPQQNLETSFDMEEWLDNCLSNPNGSISESTEATATPNAFDSNSSPYSFDDFLGS